MISKILPLLVVLCAAAPSGVIAEIRTYKGGAVRAASYEIHYSEGYLVTPGYVDVSGLTFVANDSPSGAGAGAGAHDRDDDDFVADDDDEAVPAVIATTPPPTPAPTTKPTAAPVTAAPTAAPVTMAPTATPTTAPTVPKAITAAPTASPTASPVTAAPTEPKAVVVPEPAPEPAPEGGGRRRKLDHSMAPGGSTVSFYTHICLSYSLLICLYPLPRFGYPWYFYSWLSAITCYIISVYQVSLNHRNHVCLFFKPIPMHNANRTRLMLLLSTYLTNVLDRDRAATGLN